MTQRTRGTVCALVIGIALVAALPRPARASWYEDAAGYEYALRRQRSDHAPVLVYFRTERRLFEKEYGSRGYPALFLRADGRGAARLSTGGPPARFLAQFGR